MNYQERLAYGLAGEKVVLELLLAEGLDAIDTREIYGDCSTLDRSYAIHMNLLHGDIRIFGYGDIDVKRGRGFVSQHSASSFEGKAFIFIDQGLNESSLWVLDAPIVKDCMNTAQIQGSLRKAPSSSDEGFFFIKEKIRAAKDWEKWISIVKNTLKEKTFA
jgi:hypothetical protein